MTMSCPTTELHQSTPEVSLARERKSFLCQLNIDNSTTTAKQESNYRNLSEHTSTLHLLMKAVGSDQCPTANTGQSSPMLSVSSSAYTFIDTVIQLAIQSSSPRCFCVPTMEMNLIGVDIRIFSVFIFILTSE
jgi:hypothetical protein